ncbi:hypothetical protein AX14_006740 [Amanita brunnescens Koide BX004]|nr:hypothetical protein AX14_006740 [Amanita brunnescens Koide BX004]
MQPAVDLYNNNQITDLGAGPTPDVSDPWHRAHARVCAHAATPCAACSVALFCCTCRALRLTPGPPPASPSGSTGPSQRTRSISPALFRMDVGNGTPPPEFDSYEDDHDDDSYTRALAESDTCDNSSCPRGANEPATYSITVEQFDEGSEETYERIFRACSTCNRSCRKSFMGHRVKARVFDNSTREALVTRTTHAAKDNRPHIESAKPRTARRTAPAPGSAAHAREHSDDEPIPVVAGTAGGVVAPSPSPVPDSSVSTMARLQDALLTLNARPATPAAFVATVRVKHDALCSHPVSSCPTCSCGLICCSCKCLFTPAVARHLACTECKHVAFSCCGSASCCSCGKLWLPSDSVLPPLASIQPLATKFRGGTGSDTGVASSPEPEIWTPSPRSSPDEIDDLTARAALPLPASHSGSDASRAPSRASSADEPVNVAATPLPTPDYSSMSDSLIDGLTHPSFPDRALLDEKDKRHFLSRGDLSVTSLKLYARRIFTDTSHWITAGHFLVDIFQGCTLNGSRDDFRRFVILVGTHLGFGDLALSMSESLDVNRKMADEYMRLRDVATTWKQKAKANSKDARNGKRAQDELMKAQGDIKAILEERDIFINQRRELMARDDELTTELNRVHRDYSAAIDDNTRFAANIEALNQDLARMKDELNNSKNMLSMAEHHRDKAECDCSEAVLRFDKAIADRARNKSFYEARITALTSAPIQSSQPDSEVPLSAAAIDRSVLVSRLENLKKELSVRDSELAKLRSEVSLSDDVRRLQLTLAIMGRTHYQGLGPRNGALQHPVGLFAQPRQ